MLLSGTSRLPEAGRAAEGGRSATGKDPNDWLVFLTKAQLGRSLTGLKQYAEAEAVLQEAYQGLTARKDQVPPRQIPATGQALVELYEAWGKKEQAAKWRQRLAPAAQAKP